MVLGLEWMFFLNGQAVRPIKSAKTKKLCLAFYSWLGAYIFPLTDPSFCPLSILYIAISYFKLL